MSEADESLVNNYSPERGKRERGRREEMGDGEREKRVETRRLFTLTRELMVDDGP